MSRRLGRACTRSLDRRQRCASSRLTYASRGEGIGRDDNTTGVERDLLVVQEALVEGHRLEQIAPLQIRGQLKCLIAGEDRIEPVMGRLDRQRTDDQFEAEIDADSLVGPDAG